MPSGRLLPPKPNIPVSSDIFNTKLIFVDKSKEDAQEARPQYEESYFRETASARQATFTRKLRQEPTNVGLWLEFVNFQDKLDSFSKLSQRKQLERKLSILEKAIENNPTSLELIEEHLSLVSILETYTGVLKTWDKHLENLESRDSNCYWKLVFKYIEFRTSHFSCFNREEVMVTFSEFFKKLPADSVVKVELLTLLFRFLYKTGHFELLIALLQAVIEVNLEVLNYGSVDLEAYADQWDSGLCDRIGYYIDTSSLSTPHFRSNLALLEAWCLIEEYRTEQHLFPVIDDEVDDLERNVLFHDVSPYLVTFGIGEIYGSLKAVLKSFTNCVRVPCAIDVFKTNSFVQHDNSSLFLRFTWSCFETLLAYYHADWEFTCTFMLLTFALHNDIEKIKTFLSSNRHSVPHFVAFGIFCLLIQDFEQAKLVLLKVAEKEVGDLGDVINCALAVAFQKLGDIPACSSKFKCIKISVLSFYRCLQL